MRNAPGVGMAADGCVAAGDRVVGAVAGEGVGTGVGGGSVSVVDEGAVSVVDEGAVSRVAAGRNAVKIFPTLNQNDFNDIIRI